MICAVGLFMLQFNVELGRWVTVVAILTRLTAGRLGVRIPAGVIDFFLLQIVKPTFGADPASISVVTRVISLGTAVRACVDLSPPSSTEAKNEWNRTSIPCQRVYTMIRKKIQASLVIRDLTLRVFAIIRFRGKKP
jgi:hypothetical protein